MTNDSISVAVVEHTDDMIALRRDFHQHPELAFEETYTASVIASRLAAMDLEVRTKIGRTGVIGVLRGHRNSVNPRTIMIRADMDALPVQEANNVPYASQSPGKMHACGHDGHVAIVLTVAAILAKQRDTLSGNIIFAFQPAEERAGGAKEMIDDGALDNPKVDATIGLHLWSPFPIGTVGIKAGPIFASADEIILKVRGQGGHGAIPEQSVDPIIATAQIITALQTLVSREISPRHAAVVTIGTVHGGTAFNVIADEVDMHGTVRTYDPADYEHLMRRIPELANNIATSMRATCEFSVDVSIPPCINDAKMAEIVQRAAEATTSVTEIRADCSQTVGDDMSYFLNAVPGCYFLVGAGNVARGITATHHNASFDIDEACLPIGTEILTRAALAFLKE
jgi:amidohydrolase